MIHFQASPAVVWTVTALALLAGAGLIFLEWRRPQCRHRAARMAASVAAVGALAGLGLAPAWVIGGRFAGVAVLWTPGARAADADPALAGDKSFALPQSLPGHGIVVPDTATLLRRYPAIATLHIFGDGLDAGNLEALRGLRLVFHPSAGPATPAIVFARYPRTLALGAPLEVTGQVGGLPPGSTPALTLEAPGGATTKAIVTPADAAGRAEFSVRAAASPALGRFVWRLRLVPGEDEAIGIAVLPPRLPRVLILESSPHFDTADLRRWFAQAGGTLIARTTMGRERDRFAASTRDAPPEFGAVDATLLAGFDLVLTDPRAVAALTGAERSALLAAVADGGLGLLAFAEETAEPAPLLPWQLAPAADVPPDEGEPLARPTWRGQAEPIAVPLPCAPLALTPQPGQSALIRDGQDRLLAASAQRGRGHLTLTLLRDSGRWLRGNDSGAFSAYWSFLFSQLARPLDDAAGQGHWTLLEGASGPVFVDEPLTLLWSGPVPPNPSAEVRAEGGAPPDDATLALAADPAEPGRWRATYWPRRPGWHHVAMAGGAFDFQVDAASAWPALAARARAEATARLAQESGPATAAAADHPVKGNLAIPASCLFVLFVGSAGYLWIERRRDPQPPSWPNAPPPRGN